MKANFEDRERFLRRVEDAAAQSWLMHHWDRDQEQEDDGCRTVYAVDADVIAFYADPSRIATREGGRWGYSEVFRDDPAEYSVALGRRLADYIMFDLQDSGGPLIVVPPIHGEVTSMFNALAYRMGKNPPEPSVDLEALRDWDERAKYANPAASPEVTKKLLDDLVKVLNVGFSSEAHQFQKIAELLRDRKIVPAQSLEPRDKIPEEVREVLSAPLSLRDMFDLSVATDGWRQILLPAGQRTPKDAKLAADAEALARLQLWNKVLRPKKWRIVYVSGARHLIEAADRLAKANEVDHPDDMVEVRHPRHFLASPKVVSIEATSEKSSSPTQVPKRIHSGFVDLIRTFLSDCRVESVSNMGLDAKSRLAAELAFNANTSIGSEFSIAWKEYLDDLKVEWPEHGRFADKFKAYVSRVSGSDLRTFESALSYRKAAVDVLDQMLDEAWEHCFSAAVGAGLFIGRGRVNASGEPSRRVPPIMFDPGWCETNKFVDMMSQENGDPNLWSHYGKWLERIKGEVGEKAYPYVYYLAHAALFAGRGDWRIGAIVARRSVEKSFSVQEAAEDNLAHGREGAYLASFCMRHSYRTLKDLEEAASFLAKANSILGEENSDDRTREQGVLPERFEAEGLSIEMTRSLHIWFLESNGKIDHEAARDLRRKTISLAEKVLASSEELAGKRLDLSTRLAANIIMLSALSREFDSDFDAAGIRIGSINQLSRFQRALLLFFNAVHEPGRNLRQVNKEFSDAKLFIMPYDQVRFNYLAQVIQGLAGLK